MLTVHLRVNDEAGQPTPVRLRATGPAGEPFTPLGRHAEFPTGRNEAVGGVLRADKLTFAYIDGACEIPLPAGVPLLVEAWKGPEFHPLAETVTLGPGQISLRLTVRRAADLARNGWVGIDTRCHFLAPHDALLEARAEGLAVANLLVSEIDVPSSDGKLYPVAPNLSAFSGQAEALRDSETAVVVNTHNVHPVLGRLALLHTHRPTFPLISGGRDANDDWALADWCDQAHRRRGLVVWTHAFRPDCGLVGGEALVELILGRVDAIECDLHEKSVGFFATVYRLWNAGFVVPLVGASGKDSNRVALGGVRTYAPPPWVDSVRAGKTFITNGPLLNFAIDGTDPVRVRAAVVGAFPVDRIEIIANGKVIADGSTSVELEHPMPEGGWVAARCRGTGHSPFQHGRPLFAHTSPVAVGPHADPAARRWLMERVAATREWVVSEGRFSSERRREVLVGLCDAARAKL